MEGGDLWEMREEKKRKRKESQTASKSTHRQCKVRVHQQATARSRATINQIYVAAKQKYVCEAHLFILRISDSPKPREVREALTCLQHNMTRSLGFVTTHHLTKTAWTL